MPVRRLPSNPSLVHLRHQAKDLLRDHAARLPETAQRIREFHPRYASSVDEQILHSTLSLSDAQLTIARERGFSSWTRLKRHIEKPTGSSQLDLPHHERIANPVFRQAVNLLDAGDAAGLKALLRQHPNLVHQHVLFEGGNYFRSPALLEFVAENPVRHGKLPPNIVDIARIILEAGPDRASRNETLMLVATGSVPRECHVQRALIELLCRNGADPNSAIRAAAVLDEHDSVLALLDQGARLDLPVAAALGRSSPFMQLLPISTSEERHLALALASQFGRADIVQRLLDSSEDPTGSGEDPNRYNPPGGHSHATPLHQAAAAGHLDVVRLLVERGARLDLRDVLWHGTPADWAAHEGRTEVEAFLRDEEERAAQRAE